MTETTLVLGPNAAAREAAIALAAPPGAAVLLEGMPSGQDLLPGAMYIAAGCLCCAGNLVLRVSLNRILRKKPERLFIGLASAEHLETLRAWLGAHPYDALLCLTPDLKS